MPSTWHPDSLLLFLGDPAPDGVTSGLLKCLTRRSGDRRLRGTDEYGHNKTRAATPELTGNAAVEVQSSSETRAVQAARRRAACMCSYLAEGQLRSPCVAAAAHPRRPSGSQSLCPAVSRLARIIGHVRRDDVLAGRRLLRRHRSARGRGGLPGTSGMAVELHSARRWRRVAVGAEGLIRAAERGARPPKPLVRDCLLELIKQILKHDPTLVDAKLDATLDQEDDIATLEIGLDRVVRVTLLPDVEPNDVDRRAKLAHQRMMAVRNGWMQCLFVVPSLDIQEPMFITPRVVVVAMDSRQIWSSLARMAQR
jgi:hypothetical protein